MIAAASLTLIGFLVLLLGRIAYVDQTRGIIRNGDNALLLASGLAFHWITHGIIAASLVGALVGGSIFFAVHCLFRTYKQFDGLGLGDVKFMLGGGAWAHWQGIAPVMVIGSVAGLVAFMATKPDGGRIAFGPWLALALLIVVLLQEYGSAPWLIS